jgi:hypothetical protein
MDPKPIPPALAALLTEPGLRRALLDETTLAEELRALSAHGSVSIKILHQHPGLVFEAKRLHATLQAAVTAAGLTLDLRTGSRPKRPAPSPSAG